MCTNHFRKIKINQHSQQTGIKEYFLQNWSFLLLKINQLIVQMGKKNRNRNPMFPGFFKIAQQDGDSYVRNPARSADWFIMRVYKYGRDRILSLSRDYLLSDSGLDHNLALRSNIRPFLVSPPPGPPHPRLSSFALSFVHKRPLHFLASLLLLLIRAF